MLHVTVMQPATCAPVAVLAQPVSSRGAQLIRTRPRAVFALLSHQAITDPPFAAQSHGAPRDVVRPPSPGTWCLGRRGTTGVAKRLALGRTGSAERRRKKEGMDSILIHVVRHHALARALRHEATGQFSTLLRSNGMIRNQGFCFRTHNIS